MQQISAEVIYELEKLLFERPHFRSEKKLSMRKQILWIGIQKEHFVVLVFGCFFWGKKCF